MRSPLAPPSALRRALGVGVLGLMMLPLVARWQAEAPSRRAGFLAAPPPVEPGVTPKTLVLAVPPLPVVAPGEEPPPAPPPYPLLIPVAGIRAGDLTDTFGAPRDSTRVHRAIDILAPTGTPVVAATDGSILRLTRSALGGLTVYQAGPLGGWVYYYAHLDRYADGLRPGQPIAQGDTLGYVGETGNAPVPHLHFAVWKARSGLAPLEGGRAINPYPLLHRNDG